MTFPKSWVEISRRAITSNVQTFKRHLGKKTLLMTVVKSNAYGHGLIPFSTIAAAAGTDWFGVDQLDEALALRKAGILQPILVLGYTSPARFKEAAESRISITVYSKTAILAAKKLNVSKNDRLRVHLEIETGITRQGLSGSELLSLAKKLHALPHIEIEGVFTHFANIEDTTDAGFSNVQLKRFSDALKELAQIGINPPVRHTACSAAAILFPNTLFTVARVGISSYGFWSSKETQATALIIKKPLFLKPVLTWKTLIAQVKQVQKGTGISYGLTERVKRDSFIAVIPVGYWDGYDRGFSRIGNVLIHGHRCKVLGRVCMNMFMVDVTDVPGVREGMEVVLIGKQGTEVIRAEDLATQIETIHYEIVTRINPLVPRIVV
ncbi:alanine racemase [Candidatus Uhrbacteria bacterium]|nr:alanine racemase [Candidatus Uhrbacteria bacterium]